MKVLQEILELLEKVRDLVEEKKELEIYFDKLIEIEEEKIEIIKKIKKEIFGSDDELDF